MLPRTGALAGNVNFCCYNCGVILRLLDTGEKTGICSKPTPTSITKQFANMLNQSSDISDAQVIEEATVCGFNCENCEVSCIYECRIYPHSRSDDWHLQGEGNSWLLSVAGIPQMEMSAEMTLRFLTRQYFQMRSRRTLAVCT
jgi:hypothetical protein